VYFGIVSKSLCKIFPYDAVTNRSGLRFAISFRKSLSVRSGGVNILFMPIEYAKSFIMLG